MRVLLDEQLPLLLVADFPGHEVRTVSDQRWKGLTNGELLARAADEGFEVLITADRNLEFQQNLANSRLGVVLLMASSNKIEDLGPLVPRALDAIENVRPGQVMRVGSEPKT